MPDISMCANFQCSKKQICYRFKAKPGFWQSYGGYTEDLKKGGCDSYWPLDKK
jgi:hypothetical protein